MKKIKILLIGMAISASTMDKELNMGNIYSYKIKAVYKIGVESILSEEVKIEY